MPGPIALGTIRTSGVLGLRLVVQAGTLLIVARMLGPEQYGAFAGVAAMAVLLGSLSTFGTHLVLLGQVSVDPTKFRQVLTWAVPTTIGCGTFLLAVYLVVNTTMLTTTEVPAAAMVAIGMAETLLQPMFLFPSAMMMAHGQIARSQLLVLIPLVLRLGAAVTVLLLRPSAPLLLYGAGYLIASGTALALILRWARAAIPPLRTWRRPALHELRLAGGYSALTVTRAGPTELDKTLATRLAPLANAGMYAVGARIIAAATLPVAAMMFSALPRLFRDGSSSDGRITTLTTRLFASALFYSLSLSVIVWFAAPWFDWVFGSQYDGLPQMLRWLTLAIPGMALRTAAGQVLVGLEAPWLRVSFEALGLFVLVGVAILAVPTQGANGMPIALAASEWSMAVFGWFAIIISLRNTDSEKCITPPSR